MWHILLSTILLLVLFTLLGQFALLAAAGGTLLRVLVLRPADALGVLPDQAPLALDHEALLAKHAADAPHDVLLVLDVLGRSGRLADGFGRYERGGDRAAEYLLERGLDLALGVVVGLAQQRRRVCLLRAPAVVTLRFLSSRSKNTEKFALKNHLRMKFELALTEFEIFIDSA
jgi:hypothetical protein